MNDFLLLEQMIRHTHEYAFKYEENIGVKNLIDSNLKLIEEVIENSSVSKNIKKKVNYVSIRLFSQANKFSSDLTHLKNEHYQDMECQISIMNSCCYIYYVVGLKFNENERSKLIQEIEEIIISDIKDIKNKYMNIIKNSTKEVSLLPLDFLNILRKVERPVMFKISDEETIKISFILKIS